MEKTISELKASGLEIKLTDEKLYFNTPATQETLALRSVNGVAIVDLVEQYNDELSEFKKGKFTSKTLFILSLLLIVLSVATINKKDSPGEGGIIFGLALLGYWFYYSRKITRPTLKSVVRINTNGGSRSFAFDKNDVVSGNVAEFVARVEDTLTAFHKTS